MQTKSVFPGRAVPYFLILPQLIVVGVFFLWPALRVMVESLLSVNAFGTNARFAGLSNFIAVLTSGGYGDSVATTAIYSSIVTFLSMAVGLFIAVLVDGVRRARAVYRTFFAWTYAVPTAVVGTLWLFMFNPQTGAASAVLNNMGIPFNFTLNGFDAMSLIVMLTVWQQAAYNFLFFTAGLQGIPRQVLEAATLDGAGSIRRFWRITFPLLSPTTFYLLVLNITYVFFQTFAIVNIVTQGGPYNATDTMVYQIYLDAFQNSNTSIAAAETVLLIVLVTVLTIVQFRYINRRVHYQ